MRGRGLCNPHRKHEDADRDPSVPVLSWDYCYLSGRSQGRDSAEDVQEGASAHFSPVLAMWDRRSRGLYAYLLLAKGTSFQSIESAVGNIVEDIDGLGYKKVVFR